jgi:hypothetical protein
LSAVVELLAVVEPNNVMGAVVAVASCLGAVLWNVLLFSWDQPGTTKADRDQDVTRGMYE